MLKLNPIELFDKWYKEELNLSKVKIPTACCLSTIGTDGFPNARFVSLKEILHNKFVVTGPLTSRKGIEISKNNKVALTFWWTETERQVRVQGVASQIPEELADRYFAARDRDSQIVSSVSKQGMEIENPDKLVKKYYTAESEFLDQPIPRPANWGGYSVEPLRVEFLEFKATRFHDRKLYERIKSNWIVKQIQP